MFFTLLLSLLISKWLSTAERVKRDWSKFWKRVASKYTELSCKELQVLLHGKCEGKNKRGYISPVCSKEGPCLSPGSKPYHIKTLTRWRKIILKHFLLLFSQMDNIIRSSNPRIFTLPWIRFLGRKLVNRVVVQIKSSSPLLPII